MTYLLDHSQRSISGYPERLLCFLRHTRPILLHQGYFLSRHASVSPYYWWGALTTILQQPTIPCWPRLYSAEIMVSLWIADNESIGTEAHSNRGFWWKLSLWCIGMDQSVFWSARLLFDRTMYWKPADNYLNHGMYSRYFLGAISERIDASVVGDSFNSNIPKS